MFWSCSFLLYVCYSPPRLASQSLSGGFSLFTCSLILLLVKQSDWQIWNDRKKMHIAKYILNKTSFSSILGSFKSTFVLWEHMRFCSEPSNGGGRCFPLASYGSFSPLQYYQRAALCEKYFQCRGVSPLFVRQKDIGWVVKVSIIKISCSRNIFHHRNNCKACNKTYHWSKYCKDIVEISTKYSML